jgi:hypothetical protein
MSIIHKNLLRSRQVLIIIGLVVAMVALIAGTVYAQSPQTGDSDKRVIAIVLGKKITVKDKDRLNGLIFGTLLEQFAKDNRIEPTEEEIDTFILKTEEKGRQNQIKFEADRKKLIAELKATALSERERKDKESQLQTIEKILKMTREMEERTQGMGESLRRMRRKSARQFVRAWKINKALYAKYGGRVIFQQAGVEPLDAYRDFLKEHESNGSFKILDKKYETPFWRYFVNDAMHTFYSKDDGVKFINTPWWMMEQQE